MTTQPLPDPDVVVTVSEFAQRLATVFKRVKGFDRIGVSGEISEYVTRPNGTYVTIKDRTGVLKCYAFASVARTFPRLAVGTAVIAIGSVEVFAPQSRYQLLLAEIRLTGEGELFRKYLELKERFRSEGLFDAARKRPIPPYPRSIALVSAPGGKGAEDFLAAMRIGAPSVRIQTFETRVQGDGAEIDIATAIDRADRSDADAIVVARGGGSFEDLFPFNLEPAVRAVVRARLPVVTAIGHTDDRHLTDEAADASFGTPSLAAEFFVKHRSTAEQRLRAAAERLDRAARSVLANAAQRADTAREAVSASLPRYLGRREQQLEQRRTRLAQRSPRSRVAEMGTALARADGRLRAGFQRILEVRARSLALHASRIDGLRARPFDAQTRRVERLQMRLDALNPQMPLERGYAIVSFNGAPLRDASRVRAGDSIRALLYRGAVEASVQRVETD